MLRRLRFLSVLVGSLLAPALAAQSSLLELISDPGDYIGGGQHLTFTPADGSFTAATNFDGGVTVRFSGGTHFWTCDFAPLEGQPFTVGAYVGATRFPFQGPQEPGLSVTGDGRGCNRSTGRFVVLELERGPSNTITRFAADFEQHCEGAQPALLGSIRFASSVTVEPRLALGSVAVIEGDLGLRDAGLEVFLTRRTTLPVTFDHATRDDSALEGADYLATAGTATIAPGTLSTLLDTFVRANATLQAERRFFVDLSAVSGVALATPSAAVRIVEDDGNRNLLFLDSTPFDYIGQGVRKQLTGLDGNFSGTASTSVASITFQGSDFWTLSFAAPAGSPLVPGTYEGAFRHPFQPAGSPGLSVSGEGRGCNTLTGRFVVHAIEKSGTTLTRFEADFEQHCEGGTSALFGSIRLNSDRPVTPGTPVMGDFGADPWADLVWRHPATGLDATTFLDDSANSAGDAALLSVAGPDWRIAGTQDWNGDGETDLLWRDEVAGRTALTYHVGTALLGAEFLVGTPGLGWRLAGTGRFDDDGWADLVWRHAVSGDVRVALMNGSRVAAQRTLPGEPDLDWQIVAAGDFDQSGEVDLLWRNSVTGANRIWLFTSGFFRRSEALRPLAGAQWRVAGCADLDRDGRTDILWQNDTTGVTALWTMRGTQRTGVALLPRRSAGWSLTGPR
jgi:hypothetical protein